ncbi:MAG: IS21 family transposase [Bdellovibrionales bacterium]|nr:IS21 family transposase [Bdellovibrionales bacterium]
MLEAEVQSKILNLYFNEKKSIRRIAQLVGVDRKAVKRVIHRRSIQLEKLRAKRPTLLDPYKDQVKELLIKDPNMAASTMLTRLRDAGYIGGLTILRSYVRELKAKASPRLKEAFLRLEFAPGECAQVDWGEFGDPFKNGVKIHCFVMVLCYSRMTYIEFTRSERFEDFIRCHENAFSYFAGVPKECWYDNLATAVQDRYSGLVRFNPRFFAYMGHHHIAPHACNPARGNEKGRVEVGIKFIRSHFWSGREFKDFDDLCTQAILWRDQYLNLREHRSTRRLVRNQFESEEKIVLRPMNDLKYDTDEVISKVVGPDFHITFESNKYSVPWTLVSLPVTIRINAKTLKVYYQEKYVAGHERSYFKNKVFTNPKHQEGLLSRKPGAQSRDKERVVAVLRLGDGVRQYYESLRASSRSLRMEVNRLLGLSAVYGAESLNQACFELLKDGIIGIDNLERYLRVENVATKNPELMHFNKAKLNHFVPGVSLQPYDELLKKEEEQITNPNEGDKSNE